MPTIYIIGDSTVDNFEPPFRGWGWALPDFLVPGIRVCNHAKSGRSSRSFYDEGLFEPVRQGMQAGDVLLIQFGHNDEKDDSLRHTDAFGSYQDFLRSYCQSALEKGALPVLITSVCRRIYAGNNLLYTHAAYPEAVRHLARDMELPCLDLEMASRRLFLSGTQEDVASLFVRLSPGEHPKYPDGHDDKTHFNAYGAKKIAGLVASLMAQEPRLHGLVRASLPDSPEALSAHHPKE